MHPGELTLLRIIGQDVGSIRSTSTATTCACWPATETCSSARRTRRACRAVALHDNHDARPGDGRHLRVDRQGPELGRLRTYERPLKPTAAATCTPDANGYHNDPTAPNYYEWCGDHNKALESKPFGNVGSGGPVTLPDPGIVANGPWYGAVPISVRTQPRALSAARRSRRPAPSRTVRRTKRARFHVALS